MTIFESGRNCCHQLITCSMMLLLLLLFSKFFQGVGAEPAFTMPLQNITVQVGKNATFTCNVRHIQGYKVGWVKADTKAIQAIGEHVIVHNPRIFVSQEDAQKHHLHITTVTLEDAGPYMCQLNTDPMKSQQGYLDVIVPADITRIVGTESVMEGGTARLVCEARGYPEPKVYWNREDKTQTIAIWDTATNTKKEVTAVKGRTLELARVMRSQMGKYLCIANNGHPPAVSRVAELTVNFRPVINVPNPTVFAEEGADVTVECLVEAFPKGIHYWQRDQATMITSNAKYLVHEYLPNDYSLQSKLTVRDFSPEDQGEFHCVYKNALSPQRGVQGTVLIKLKSEVDESTELIPDYSNEVTDDDRQQWQQQKYHSDSTTSSSTNYYNSRSRSDDSNRYWIEDGGTRAGFEATERPAWFTKEEERQRAAQRKKSELQGKKKQQQTTSSTATAAAGNVALCSLVGSCLLLFDFRKHN